MKSANHCICLVTLSVLLVGCSGDTEVVRAPESSDKTPPKSAVFELLDPTDTGVLFRNVIKEQRQLRRITLSCGLELQAEGCSHSGPRVETHAEPGFRDYVDQNTSKLRNLQMNELMIKFGVDQKTEAVVLLSAHRCNGIVLTPEAEHLLRFIIKKTIQVARTTRTRTRNPKSQETAANLK